MFKRNGVYRISEYVLNSLEAQLKTYPSAHFIGCTDEENMFLCTLCHLIYIYVYLLVQ